MALLATEAGASGGVSSPVPVGWWVVFVVAVLALLMVDLLVLNREAHVIGTREAAWESAGWIALGLAFAIVVWWLYPNGGEAAGEYLSGYLIEKSLSVDNLFVFVLIFSYFSVPDKYHHRVLFWGIFGALVFRGIFIALGAVLLARFAWVAFVFGGFLIYTGARLATQDEIEVHPESNPLLRLFRRVFRVTTEYHEEHFFIRRDGVLWATPLLAVLVVVESTDILFAVDSIPAIFGVTRDPFLVFSSNAFALLGLRALYFLLASAVRRFRHLDTGVAVILVLVGVKLIAEEAVTDLHVPTWVSLLAISGILGGAVWLSIRERDDEATKRVVEEYAEQDYHDVVSEPTEPAGLGGTSPDDGDGG